MSRPRQRFCRRQHDTLVVGRDSRGYCRACRSLRDQERGTNTRPRYRVKPRLASDHAPFGTCDLTTCPYRGRCHCSEDCPATVRLASRTYGPYRITGGQPRMYAQGHAPRHAEREDEFSTHPHDVECRERIAEMREDITLQEIAHLAEMSIAEVERVANGGSGGVHAYRRIRIAHQRMCGVGTGLLPTAPLRHHLASAIRARDFATRTGEGDIRAGLTDLARRYADRFGGTHQTASRLFQRVFEQESVTVDVGDQIAVFLELHPLLIWPDEWVGAA